MDDSNSNVDSNLNRTSDTSCDHIGHLYVCMYVCSVAAVMVDLQTLISNKANVTT